jgi:arginine deiminase
MHTSARARESFILNLIRKNHSLFEPVRNRIWYTPESGGSIEGGDILVLSETAAVIGASARTGSDSIEALAWNLLNSNGGLKDILAVKLPAARAFMHLDTVLTMVDRDTFILFPGVEYDLEVFRLSAAGKSAGSSAEELKEIRVTRCDSLQKALSAVLGLKAVRILKSGGKDAGTAAREQWNDSANTLAVRPGTVITYNRNTQSNRILREAGIDVIEIEGSELVRGRGGPRCMSMPLLREE